MADDQAWVFDSLVCFLHGPIWNGPIQNFIEEKSIIFDPNVNHDETKKEFKKIHDEYKNLVDFMLGSSFMTELQITPEQFEVACLEGRNSGNTPDTSSKLQDRGTFSFHQGLFQQIWAANDIRIFVKMMVQRNLEIQLQALDLIERRQATSSINQLTEENQASGCSNDIPNEGLYNDGKIPDDINLLVENDTDLSTMYEIKQTLSEENVQDNAVSSIGDDHNATMQDAEKEFDVNEKFKRLNLFFENEKIDSQEVKQRQEYLRTQRDKILQIKKQVRARQLNETVKKTGRPQSASATAAKIIMGEGNNKNIVTETNPETSTQLRLTLAKRLRAEIIDDSSDKIQ
uniref:Cilia- and flagella-associated protein 36 n=1 Tax=Culicoides sonorensis TaxID=179676 RepID=A0A336M389_CULSO